MPPLDEHLPRQPRAGLRRLKKFGSYLLLTAGAFLVLFPLYMTVVSSLLTPKQYGDQPPDFWPRTPQWNSYAHAFVQGQMWHYLLNSVQQTGEIVIGATITSVLAAYAFASFSFPLKRVIWTLTLATLLVPFEVTIITNFQTVNTLHLFGSMWALSVPFMVSAFGIFLLRQAFLGIPKEMREAATLDGHGPVAFLWRVALPLARPQLAAFIVVATLGAWNQYLWPLLLTSDSSANRTIQIGLKALNAGTIQGYNVVLAGSVIAAVPMIVLMIVFNKQLVRSLTGGALK